MADIPKIIDAARQAIRRISSGEDPWEPSYTPPVALQEPNKRGPWVFELAYGLANRLLPKIWPAKAHHFFGEISFWTKRLLPPNSTILESTSLTELPPDVLESEMFDRESRGDNLGAARIAMALLWKNVTDIHNYRIEEAIHGDINPPQLETAINDWQEQAADFIKRHGSPACTIEKQQTHRVLASIILHFLAGDITAAKERLMPIINHGRLFDPELFPIIEKLAFILRIKEFKEFSESPFDFDNPLQIRLRILLTYKLLQFAGLCRQKDNEAALQNILFIPAIDLSEMGNEYLTLFSQSIEDIFQWHTYPAKLDWHNFLNEHAKSLPIYFPHVAASEHPLIAKWLYLRFGRMYYQVDPQFARKPNWRNHTGAIKETLGEESLDSIDSQTLTALYLQGKISEEMMADARDFSRRVDRHVADGTPLTLFKIVGVEEPKEEVEQPLFTIVGATSVAIEDDSVVQDDKKPTINSTPLPVGVIMRTPVGKTPLAALARTPL